jgi:hypothetical protein
MAETAAAAAPAGSVSDVGAFGAADEYEYFANHVTACLCKSHKSSMAAMVKLYEYNYTSAASLTKVIHFTSSAYRTLCVCAVLGKRCAH